MKQNVMLTIASLLSILLLTLHITDDIVRGISKAEPRSEEHTSELQSQSNIVCRLLLEKKNINNAVGALQLYHNIDGISNNAFGIAALSHNITPSDNTAVSSNTTQHDTSHVI